MTVKTVCPHAMARLMGLAAHAYEPESRFVKDAVMRMSDGLMAVEWRVDEALPCAPEGCACDGTERRSH